MSIERAFALWKGRWRSIKDCLPMARLDKVPEYLLATAVLHNICIMRQDMVQVENQLRMVSRGRLFIDRRQEGLSKRERIAENLILRSV